MSLRSKLLISYILTALIAFGAAAFFLTINLEDRYLAAFEKSLLTQAELIENQLPIERFKSIPSDKSHLQTFVKNLSNISKSRVTIINIKGEVLADSERNLKEVGLMDNHQGRTEVRSALAHGTGVDIRISPTLKIEMMYAAVTIKRPDGKVLGVVRLAVPATLVKKNLYTVRKIIWLGLLTALLIALIVGLIFSGNITRPINRIIFASNKYSDGDFSHRIIATTKDEIGELARTLNEMATNLEHRIREIAAQNQKLEAVFNSMIEGIIVIDGNRRIVSLNTSTESIFNVTDRDVQGKLLLESIRNNDLSDIVNTVFHEKRPISRELTLTYPVQGIFQINAVPIFQPIFKTPEQPDATDNNKAQEISGCLMVVHDISEIRRLETVRRDFVANVSHELKTPLTSIKGFVETLIEGAIDDKQNRVQFLKIINDHTDRIRDLIDDLLTLSHLESSKISLDISVFDLRKQAEEVILGFRSQLKKKKIILHNNLADKIDVLADKNRITQVLTNLIDNAIKFNKDSGSIMLNSQIDGESIKLTVEDTGPGIPPKDISRIFERFYRVDKARSRELGGTGLGLSIVKHIIELHGGRVGVDSVEGQGSRFWFTLYLKK